MIKTGKEKDKYMNLIRNRTAKFAENRGRRPRILITRIDPMCSDRDVKILATALADMGFDVDIHTSVQSPVEIARLALENDVHVAGIPGISKDNRELISNLIDTMESKGNKNILLALWTQFKPDEPPAFISSRPGRVIGFTDDIQAVDCVNRILDLLEQQF
jgi:methylmalonyl-CoA mutase